MLKAERVSVALLLLALTSGAQAHHTYAMFDGSKLVTVSGTVAKLEWTNPHIFLWLYVPSKEHAGQYDLYAFENGSPNAVKKLGWSATSLRPGDRITVEYYPLRDGRKGGHLTVATLADGRTLRAVGGPGAESTLKGSPPATERKP